MRAVGSYSSGPPARGTFVLKSTEYRNQGAVSHYKDLADPCSWFLFGPIFRFIEVIISNCHPALLPAPRQHMEYWVGQPHVHGGPHGGHEGEVVQSDISLAVVKRVREAAIPIVCDVRRSLHLQSSLGYKTISLWCCKLGQRARNPTSTTPNYAINFDMGNIRRCGFL